MIFQRWPLVRAALRRRLRIGPTCSTTQAGTLMPSMAAKIIPGTINNTKPKTTAIPMQIAVPTTGSSRRNARPRELPSRTGLPTMSWNAA